MKHLASVATLGFIVGCLLGALVFAQYAVKADQVGQLEIISEYPSKLTAFFGDEPDVYIKNVGDTYSRFAYRGREVAIAPGERMHLDGVKPGDEVSIDIVMPLLLGAHVTGVAATAPVKADAKEPEEAGKADTGTNGRTALAAAE